MHTPIIVLENGDLLAFREVSHAERKIEPIDVENKIYDFYDAKGRVLSADVIEVKKGVERVKLREREDIEKRPGELRESIQKFLKECGEDRSWTSEASLEDLVRYVVENYPTR